MLNARSLAGVGFALIMILFPCIARAGEGRPATPSSKVPEVGKAGSRRLSFEIARAYPHDPAAFTQGLFFKDGFLYEGTGRRGRSSLRKVELETGRVVKQVDLPKSLFGEGIAPHGGRIYQLTWRAGLGLVYDLKTFRLKRRFRYRTEGWGLTTDGTHLIMSDGTDTLHFLDPESFRLVRGLKVRDQTEGVKNLNELEWVEGRIFANIWMRDDIVIISPDTGALLGRIDLGRLAAMERPPGPEAVLNGIAYDPEGDRLFVTGKLWSHVYEIRCATGFLSD